MYLQLLSKPLTLNNLKYLKLCILNAMSINSTIGRAQDKHVHKCLPFLINTLLINICFN